MLRRLEAAGRTCYRSEDKITAESAERFVASIIRRGHESVLEHETISVRIICDRGVSHELVRHRIASYSQESTRYCNYGNKDMEFIKPSNFELDSKDREFLIYVERYYEHCLAIDRAPQQARYFLPNGLKTEVVATMNLRAWRHFFALRCAMAAHPDIRKIALDMLAHFKKIIPVVFDDLTF